MQICAPNFVVSDISFERMLVDDVSVCLEFMISHNVVTDPSDAVPDGVLTRLVEFKSELRTTFCSPEETLGIIRHMWTRVKSWLAPSVGFIKWA